MMLRALNLEHCESNPDDAFSRGILEPLNFIERGRYQKMERHVRLPLIIVVDALDECLTVTTDRRPGSGSITVAHLLERALSSSKSQHLTTSFVKFVIPTRQKRNW